MYRGLTISTPEAASIPIRNIMLNGGFHIAGFVVGCQDIHRQLLLTI